MSFKKNKKDLILIYQMGKVASISIHNAINQQLNHEKADLFRMHQLNSYAVEQHKAIIKNGSEADVIYATHFLKVYNEIDKLLSQRNKKVLLVTGVRDPVSVSIAGMFQNISAIFPPYDMIDNKYACDVMLEIYFTMLQKAKKGDNESPLMQRYGAIFNVGITFFENEIKSKFGIDVYKHSFDPEKGYQVIRGGNIDILIYKFEKLSSIFPYIGDFVKPYLNDEISEKFENAGKNKSYAKIYELFKKSISFSKKDLYFYYKSNHVKHFYSKKEIDAFYNRLE